MPVIIDWSSSGGTTQNKDNVHDIMYLVQQGDVINFSSISNENADFTWEVNKIEKKNTPLVISDDFNFSVPNEKGIWEIHLKVLNSNGEDHVEWVVSTLNIYEMPYFFDYFSDKKLSGRTETDPWGRPLPEWTVVLGIPDVSKGYLTSTVSGDYKYTKLRLPSDITHGTWQWKWRFPSGSAPGHASDAFAVSYHIDVTETMGEKGYRLDTINDGHFWYDVMGLGYRLSLLNNIAGGWGITISPDYDWHTVTIIRKINDAFTIYYDGEIVPGDASDGTWQDCSFCKKFQDYPDSNYLISQFFSLYFGVFVTGGKNIFPEIDNIVVWKNNEVVPTMFEDNILIRTPEKINVLIDQGHGSNYSSIGSWYNELLDMLKERNSVIKTIRFTRVDDTILNNFDIYITTPHISYSTTSQQAMKNFVANGGRILLIGGSDYGGSTGNSNSWLQDFGMKFKAEGGSDEAVYIIPHLLTINVTKIKGAGYTYITVTSPAQKLIAATVGDDKIALAAYESGIEGRVVSIADEWPFTSDSTKGLDRPGYDHRQLAVNIANWLVGECPVLLCDFTIT